jgi:hypothetical protein
MIGKHNNSKYFFLSFILLLLFTTMAQASNKGMNIMKGTVSVVDLGKHGGTLIVNNKQTQRSFLIDRTLLKFDPAIGDEVVVYYVDDGKNSLIKLELARPYISIRKTATSLKITYTQDGLLRQENRSLVEKAFSNKSGHVVFKTATNKGREFIDEFQLSRMSSSFKIRLGKSIQWIDVSYSNRPVESFTGNGQRIHDQPNPD